MLFHLTDSQAGLCTALSLSKGSSPRNGLEVTLKVALLKGRDQDTAVSCVRGHVEMPSNKKVDREAAYRSILGKVVGSPDIATFEGLRASSKAN